MKSVRNCIQLLVLIFLLFGSFSPTSTARAAVNGQQIQIYACEASRLDVSGYNQYGQWVTYTYYKTTSLCGPIKIYNWWWKGYVSVSPYYVVSDVHRYYPGQMTWVYVPTYQSSNWVSVTVPAPSARQRILWRAQTWVYDRVSYSQSAYREGYRKDCSGYVSFAWSGAKPGFTTGTWKTNAYSISFDSLQPGDALNSTGGGHMLLFQGWVNKSSGVFNAYEENPYYGGAHLTTSITLDRNTGRLSIPAVRYTYPGTYFAIRKNGF